MHPKVFGFYVYLIALSGGRIRFSFALGRSGEMIGFRAASLSSRILLYEWSRHLTCNASWRWRRVLFDWLGLVCYRHGNRDEKVR
jgi:hypothetical protein